MEMEAGAASFCRSYCRTPPYLNRKDLRVSWELPHDISMEEKTSYG
jgi:hypothetical protein